MIRPLGLGPLAADPPISATRKVTVRQGAGVGIGLFMVFLMVVMAIGVTDDPGETVGSGNGFLDRWFFGILIVPTIWGALWYFINPRMVIDDVGVVVQNPYNGWVLPWTVVAGAGLDRSLQVVLRDGDRIRSILFGPAFSSPLTTRRRVDQVVELINREASRRSGIPRQIEETYEADALISPDRASAPIPVSAFPDASTMHHTNRGLVSLVVIALGWTLLCAVTGA